MLDLISIIVPVYNVEKYIRRCVDSILSQTYKNFELILVNDGSPDMCPKLCDDYSKIDIRVKVIHKKNGGLSEARNFGIDAASGKYLTFIDSDDWIVDNYLERLENLLKSTQSDISICNFLKTKTQITYINLEKIELKELTNFEVLEQMTGPLYEQLTVSWGKLFKSELFRNERFPIKKIHEDEFTTYKLFYKANKIVITSEKLVYYWQREDSITGSRFKIRNKLDAIEALEERANFYHSIGLLKLKNLTFKSLFGIYRDVIFNLKLENDQKNKEIFLDKYEHFKEQIRLTNQSIIYKIYYEFYFINPNFTERVKKILTKNRSEKHY